MFLASILRHVYLRNGLGVGHLTRVYGGNTCYLYLSTYSLDLSIEEVEKRIKIHIAVEGISVHNLKELHVHHDILSNFFKGLSCGLNAGNLKLMVC